MSGTYDGIVYAAINQAFYVLKGLRDASFRDFAQARPAFLELHSYLRASYFAQFGMPTGTPQTTQLWFAPVPTFVGLARTALLHLQQQQQCILLAPTADLTLITVIFESLHSATRLPNNNPAEATDAKQLLREAGPGEGGCLCQVFCRTCSRTETHNIVFFLPHTACSSVSFANQLQSLHCASATCSVFCQQHSLQQASKHVSLANPPL
jgi:hypothetical protein